MELYTKNLNEDTLSISGADGATRGLTPDGVIYTAHANGDTKGTGAVHSRGFHLAGVDIPHPTGYTANKTGSVMNFNASLNLADSKCGLAWVKRTAQVTENGKTANKEVYVLAMDGCTASGGTFEEEEDNNTYYFKCVSRFVGSGLMETGVYSTFESAKAVCESGQDPSAIFYKYLSGGEPKPGCNPLQGQDCELTPTYYIRYQCSTEPPKAANGYGFDENLCMVIQPHD